MPRGVAKKRERKKQPTLWDLRPKSGKRWPAMLDYLTRSTYMYHGSHLLIWGSRVCPLTVMVGFFPWTRILMGVIYPTQNLCLTVCWCVCTLQTVSGNLTVSCFKITKQYKRCKFLLPTLLCFPVFFFFPFQCLKTKHSYQSRKKVFFNFTSTS